MPRQIDAEETFDAMRDEIDYTTARLEDEPLAAPSAGRTAEWHARTSAVEATSRAIDREDTYIDAARAGGNLVIDAVCQDFADELLSALGKDRTSERWRSFFRGTVSEFVRQPLNEQVLAVRGWLTDPTDEVLLAYLPALESATARCERAIARESPLADRRTSLARDRQALSAYLTEQRDLLHSELVNIARSNRLPRNWADSFFRMRRGATPRKPSAPAAPSPT